MIMTTLVLVAGFMTVVFSDMREQRVFAIMGAVTLTAALFGDLVLLPAPVAAIRPVARRRIWQQSLSVGVLARPMVPAGWRFICYRRTRILWHTRRSNYAVCTYRFPGVASWLDHAMAVVCRGLDASGTDDR